ncbi:hypothetical protein D3C78_1803020 [compost metagenome]
MKAFDGYEAVDGLEFVDQAGGNVEIAGGVAVGGFNFEYHGDHGVGSFENANCGTRALGSGRYRKRDARAAASAPACSK